MQPVGTVRTRHTTLRASIAPRTPLTTSREARQARLASAADQTEISVESAQLSGTHSRHIRGGQRHVERRLLKSSSASPEATRPRTIALPEVSQLRRWDAMAVIGDSTAECRGVDGHVNAVRPSRDSCALHESGCGSRANSIRTVVDQLSDNVGERGNANA
jgi:hypothetical protein